MQQEAEHEEAPVDHSKESVLKAVEKAKTALLADLAANNVCPACGVKATAMELFAAYMVNLGIRPEEVYGRCELINHLLSPDVTVCAVVDRDDEPAGKPH